MTMSLGTRPNEVESATGLLAAQGVPTRNRSYEGGQVGRVLAQRYRLEAEIGAGAMGKVYQAMDLKRRQRCAVKLVHPEADRMLHAHPRFLNEAKVSAQLFHPNIVTVREFNQDADGTEFMVLELLDGMDLHEHLAMYGRLPLRRALDVLRGVGSALQYAHDLGIVHRDIKPENIFLSRQRGRLGQLSEAIKVLDFGLARLLHEPGDAAAAASGSSSVRITQDLVVGTLEYLAPEATQGSSQVDARADQWSLAVVAYQILSGQLPFDHSNKVQLCNLICTTQPTPLEQLVPELPPHLCRAIETALAKDPAHRFAKINHFIRALDNLAPASTVSSPRTLVTPNPLGSIVSTQVAAPPESAPDNARDTLGQVHPDLSADHLVWVHQANLAPVKPQVPLVGSPDLHQTVQYSADELQALARQSLLGDHNVPLAVAEDSPTRPYLQVAANSDHAATLVHPAEASALKEGLVHETMLVAPESLVAADGTITSVPTSILSPPVVAEASVSPLGHTVLLASPVGGEGASPHVYRPRIPWLGIGAGSAMFCLGFLIALFWTVRYPRLHGLSLRASGEQTVATAALPTLSK